MGRLATINVGDKFTAKPNVELTVIHYHSSVSVIVEDEQGNKRDVNAKHLRDGNMLWRTKDGKVRESNGAKSARKLPPKIGERYESANHGWYEIIDIESYSNMTIRFDDTGATRSGVFTHAAFSGKVADPTRPRADDPRVRFPTGSTQKSNSWGDYTIVEMLASGIASIRWHDSGNLQENVLSSQVRGGSVTDIVEYKREYDYLQPASGAHYVYVARLEGQIVYVGQGYGKRYLHCRSGCSHNRELNRLYFSGVEVEVAIHKDGLSKGHATGMEKQLIELVEPYCNQRRYNVSFDT